MKVPHILFEDDEIFIVEKPSGLHTISHPGEDEISLGSFLLDEKPFLAEVSDSPLDAGLISRLDFETSGLLVGAKTKEIWAALKELSNSERIQKTYLLLIEGCSKFNREVTSYIGSRYRGSKKATISEKPFAQSRKGREATTFFETLEVVSQHKVSLLSAIITKGQRHQIRAHISWMNSPLIGDMLYGSKRSLQEVLPNEDRPFFLHSHVISFQHPKSKEQLTFESKTTPDIVLSNFR